MIRFRNLEKGSEFDKIFKKTLKCKVKNEF